MVSGTGSAIALGAGRRPSPSSAGRRSG
ncbi:hypothetical protein [Methylobacterium sp. J-026]